MMMMLQLRFLSNIAAYVEICNFCWSIIVYRESFLSWFTSTILIELPILVGERTEGMHPNTRPAWQAGWPGRWREWGQPICSLVARRVCSVARSRFLRGVMAADQWKRQCTPSRCRRHNSAVPAVLLSRTKGVAQDHHDGSCKYTCLVLPYRVWMSMTWIFPYVGSVEWTVFAYGAVT